MLYVVNYADGQPYESYRKINSISAKLFGKADRVLEYSSRDIPESYRIAHIDIFSYKRGAGLWLWKPYIINESLSKLSEGDYLFYSDSGAIFFRDIHHLIETTADAHSDVMLFEQPLLHRQFTKKETMVCMGVKDKGMNQTLGIMLIKKSFFSVSLISEWLHNCEIEELISPKRFHCEINNYEDFISHREDQSILSTLRIKYDIPAFRDPSDYGEMPFLYCFKDVCFNPKNYENSNYPTIMLCSRDVHPFKYFFIYLIRKILLRIGIFYSAEKRIANPPALPVKKK